MLEDVSRKNAGKIFIVRQDIDLFRRKRNTHDFKEIEDRGQLILKKGSPVLLCKANGSDWIVKDAQGKEWELYYDDLYEKPVARMPNAFERRFYKYYKTDYRTIDRSVNLGAGFYFTGVGLLLTVCFCYDYIVNNMILLLIPCVLIALMLVFWLMLGRYKSPLICVCEDKTGQCIEELAMLLRQTKEDWSLIIGKSSNGMSYTWCMPNLFNASDTVIVKDHKEELFRDCRDVEIEAKEGLIRDEIL